MSGYLLPGAVRQASSASSPSWRSSAEEALSEEQSLRALEDEKNRSRITGDRKRWGRCVIVGSGPSLCSFDFERLRGQVVLAINDAVLQVPWAAALYSHDHRWIRSRLSLLGKFTGRKYIAIPKCHADLWDMPGVVYLNRSREPGLSADPSTVCIGGCSGYGALNVAVLLGAQHITLYGYDLVPGRAFASEHPEQRQMYRSWAQLFQTTLPFLEDRCITVVNASVASAIDAFPKMAGS